MEHAPSSCALLAPAWSGPSGFRSATPNRRPTTATPFSTSTSTTLERALGCLTAKQRHVIVERFLHNRLNDDIGHDLGISGSAVSLQATVGLKRLQRDVALRDWVGLTA